MSDTWGSTDRDFSNHQIINCETSNEVSEEEKKLACTTHLTQCWTQQSILYNIIATLETHETSID